MAQQPLSAGARVGPYEITTKLGEGGMGEVWRARDPRLGRDVAIKVSTAGFSERFEREARAIAALNHPNICQIYDVGPDYLVMEHIEGAPPRGPLAPAEVMRLAHGIAAALEAAHEKGITHRDLKPGNVLVTSSGIKLLDFGLARFDDTNAGVDDTATAVSLPGAILGTVAYMSPEQVQGKPADARSDVFAFGLLIYELVSGTRAFASSSMVDTMAAILRDEPAPLRSPLGEVPASLIETVLRCLRKSPNARFQTMSEVRGALESMAVTRVLPAPNLAETPSIAVLPFVNMSGDKDNEYFSDGLAEEILNLLSRIPDLRVIARTSSFAFRDKQQDITQIASALRVRTVLEGSVRRSGNRIRVTAQLIEAEHGSQLWSERYDREMTDVFAIQDEISGAISQALQVRLAPRAKVKNLEAWEHWLKGVHYRGLNRPQDVAKATAHFEQALAIDPTFAQAYSGLAICYFVLAAHGLRSVTDMTTLSIQAAQKALALDPSDSEAHTALGVMAGMFNYQWRIAEGHHVRAMACEHVSPRSRMWYAMHCLALAGRYDEAIEQSRLALQSDPLSMVLQSGVLWCLYAAGRVQEGMVDARRWLEINPHSHLVLQHLGLFQLRAGLPKDAIATFTQFAELAPWIRVGAGGLAAAHHMAGDIASAREIARQFTDADRAGFGAAIYYATAGDRDAMCLALDACYERREFHLWQVTVIPSFDPYRSDPRFVNFLARIGFAS